MKDKKICFAASSGGHFEQILMLKPLMAIYESFIITEKTLYDTNTSKKEIYYIQQINRKEKKFLLIILLNLIKSLYIFIRERPDIIITTGALAMIPICFIGKLFGKKIIFIESFAKVSSPTKTGKLLYKFADEFYIQWESLREFYPNAKYLGGIY